MCYFCFVCSYLGFYCWFSFLGGGGLGESVDFFVAIESEILEKEYKSYLVYLPANTELEHIL